MTRAIPIGILKHPKARRTSEQSGFVGVGASLEAAIRTHNGNASEEDQLPEIGYSANSFSRKLAVAAREALGTSLLGKHVGKKTLQEIKACTKFHVFERELSSVKDNMTTSYPILRATEGNWGASEAIKNVLVICKKHQKNISKPRQPEEKDGQGQTTENVETRSTKKLDKCRNSSGRMDNKRQGSKRNHRQYEPNRSVQRARDSDRGKGNKIRPSGRNARSEKRLLKSNIAPSPRSDLYEEEDEQGSPSTDRSPRTPLHELSDSEESYVAQTPVQKRKRAREVQNMDTCVGPSDEEDEINVITKKALVKSKADRNGKRARRA